MINPASILPALSGRFPVAAETVAQFGLNGHTRLSGVASASEIGHYRQVIREAALRLSQETRALEDRDTYGKAFLQVTNLWRQDHDVARFTLAERFAGVAADLLGVERVRIYHDQALFKEAGGGVTPWHQDALYWPLEAEKTLTMWMPLVDVTDNMGGMSFARGSHLEGALSSYGISDESETHFRRLLDTGRFPVDGPTAIRAGDATFHAGWTLHRAHPNTSQTMREVMTVIYLADGTRATEPRSTEQQHDLATWLPGLQPGDVAASPLNPLLPA